MTKLNSRWRPWSPKPSVRRLQLHTPPKRKLRPTTRPPTRRLRPTRPPTRRLRQVPQVDGCEKALPDKAPQDAHSGHHALDNDRVNCADPFSLMVGAQHVGQTIYIPTDAVRNNQGGVSALLVVSFSECCLVHGPFKPPVPGPFGVYVTIQFEHSVTVARCSSCESSCLHLDYWAKKQQAAFSCSKDNVERNLDKCCWWHSGGLCQS